MERNAYKVHSVPKQCKPEKESELVPKIKKEAFIFCSSQHFAEVVKWQNEDCTGLKSNSKRDVKGMSRRKNNDRLRERIVFWPVTIIS